MGSSGKPSATMASASLEVMSMISALVLRAVCSPTGPGSVWVGSHFCSTTHTITLRPAASWACSANV